MKKTYISILLFVSSLLFLEGCSHTVESPAECVLAVTAVFEWEDRTPLASGTVRFSNGESSTDYLLDHDGTLHISGLAAKGEPVVTVLDGRKEPQGTITLNFDQGAVIDATTGEDGVGHITIREDTDEVALLFVLDENGSLTCTLWLKRTDSSGERLSQKGSEHGNFPVGVYRRGT